MNRLSESHKYAGDSKLLVEEIFDDICVEAKDAKFMRAHDTGEQLHDKDFVVQRESLVIGIENIVKLLSESLRVMEQLNSGKVWC